MKTIQYGVLGCGEHALQSHAIPNQEIAELELTTACDLSQSQIDCFVDKLGDNTIQTYTDRQAFLGQPIGAVLIGTPDSCHFDDLAAAVDAGKHVFVEKPLVVKPDEIKRLPEVLQQASANGLTVSSCHPRRYDPPFMWLKDQLPDFRSNFGEPLQLRFDFSYHKPMRAWKHDRGLLLDHANHEIDLAHYLFGPSSFTATRLSDSYDRYQVAGIRDDGISFDFSGTRRLNNRTYPEWATIRFETGQITIDTHEGFARITNHETGEETRRPIDVTDYEARGLATMKNFGQAILGLAECYLSPQDLYVNTAFSVVLTDQVSWRYEHPE